MTCRANFYPRSPCGERLLAVQLGCRSSLFLSTLSLRRATARRALGFVDPDISIHALLAESDSAETVKTSNADTFLSTLSLRRATIGPLIFSVQPRKISIHALLAESDCSPRVGFCRPRYFYPRSPCGERLRKTIPGGGHIRFLSTLSLRRATQAKALKVSTLCISIHALLAESDPRPPAPQGKSSIFLSTLSLRRATGKSNRAINGLRHFYPRSPCGERLSILF